MMTLFKILAFAEILLLFFVLLLYLVTDEMIIGKKRNPLNEDEE